MTATIIGKFKTTLKGLIARARFGQGRTLAAAAAAMIALALSASPAAAWWDKDWGSRKQVTLDTSSAGAGVDGAVQNFPVLLRLDSSSFNFEDAKADGADIRFVGDDDNQLPFVCFICRKPFKDPIVTM